MSRTQFLDQGARTNSGARWLGVDSIMGIEIAAMVKNMMGMDILPSFVLNYPTIADLRSAFARTGTPGTSTLEPEATSNSSHPPLSSSTAGSTIDSSPPFSNDRSKKHAADEEADGDADGDAVKETAVSPAWGEDKKPPAPSARITLLQGLPSNGKRPFYVIADGTGSAATYIHLPGFKSNMPIYGIDSPFLRCPGRLAAAGIPGAAALIVEALVKHQPEGSFSVGGYSGGAMMAYEVCRQLAVAGRDVAGLLLIDMCCPRPAGAPDKAEVGWRVYESVAARGGLWSTSARTREHLCAVFAAVAAYHPEPSAILPARTAIIWARKGLVDRCADDDELMRMLAEADIPTKAFPGFMENTKMGAVAWGLPHKTAADLGPNGWEKYVGEALCLPIEADHLEMPMPGHVHLLHGAMEEAFSYLDGS